MANTPESAVLLVAHGSRVQASNQEVADLAERMAKQSSGHPVEHAFLELAEPSIPEGIDALVARGARRIIVIPYFLSAGRHVREDIPALVEDARRRHSGVAIELTPHFGAAEAVPGLLSAMVDGRH